MDEINRVLQSEGALELTLLSSLSRNSLKLYLTASEPPLDHVKAIWTRLLASIEYTQADEKYITAVCNAISVFLVNLTIASTENLQEVAFSKQTWLEAHRCVQKAFDKGKTKPALQVLETLCYLLDKNPEQPLAIDILQGAVKDRLRTIFVGPGNHDLKVACISISCLVRKVKLPNLIQLLFDDYDLFHHVAWEKQLQRHNITKADLINGNHRPVFVALILALQYLECRSAALKLLVLLCTKNVDEERSNNMFAEVAAVTQIYLTRNSEELTDFANNVLPLILDDQKRWRAFLDHFRNVKYRNEAQTLQYLAVLRVGRLQKFINQEELLESLPPGPDNNTISDRLIWPPDPEEGELHLLLRGSSSRIRIQTYDLLIASSSTSEAISEDILTCIEPNLKYLHNDNESHERGEILSVTRRLLKRLGSVESLQSDSCKRFVQIFTDFLQGELRPNVSYSRHSLALQSIEMIMESRLAGKYDSERLLEPLLNIAGDPFEDVRSCAIETCKSILCSADGGTGRDLLDELSLRMQLLSAKSGRHDHADAAGRLGALQYLVPNYRSESESPLVRLDKYCNLASSLDPDAPFPLHALLLTSTHRLSMAESDTEKLLTHRICSRVWKLVQTELCVDSPETATAESDEGLTGPKDLLAYSWRALRDSSLLMQAMLRSTKPSHEDLLTVGSLCFEQLTMLRHRGAFSAVAQTFGQCCDASRNSTDQTVKELLHAWYTAFVEELQKQAARLTRRSAGLPALITAILSPEDPLFFDTAMTDLIEMASKPVASMSSTSADIALPQVHALNCIKDIIHNSKFRAINDRYVGDLLLLATQSLSSNIWAIRNSGLMLLKACMMRLEANGAPVASSSTLLAHNPDHQVSLEIVSSLLSLSLVHGSDPVTSNAHTLADQSTQRSEQVFAALDLVKYVGETTHHDNLLIKQIQKYLNSPIWAIRDHAARALANRLYFGDGSASDLLPVSNQSSENELHGHLLFHRYHTALTYQNGSTKDIDELLDNLTDLMESLRSRLHPFSSPFTIGALLDIANNSMAYILNEGRSFVDLHQPLLEVIESSQTYLHPFCHARLLLGKALFYLLEGSELTKQRFALIGENALEPLSKEICDNADEAKYIIERLQEMKPAVLYAQFRLMDLLCELATDINDPDLRAPVLNALAGLLEANTFVQGYFNSKGLHQTRSAMGTGLLSGHTRDRDLCNATLRVWAIHVRLQLDGRSGLPLILFDGVNEPRKDFLELLHTAMEDGTELPTRFSAAQALNTCAPYVVLTSTGVKRNGQPPIRNPLIAVSLVYDMLNDDDDEIRHLGEKTTVAILDRWFEVELKRASKPMCALASREAIIQWIIDLIAKDGHLRDPSEQQEVSSLALQRVMGLPHPRLGHEQSLLSTVRSTSVAKSLNKIRKSMTDLFAEERQNLYVDDLEGIAQWSKVLLKCGLHLSQNVLGAFLIWVSEGLRIIQVALSNNDKEDAFPLGPTYNAEILTLFVRVVSLAAIAYEKLNEPTHSAQKRKLASQLTQLKTICDQNGVHERLIRAFDAGISEVTEQAATGLQWTTPAPEPMPAEPDRPAEDTWSFTFHRGTLPEGMQFPYTISGSGPLPDGLEFGVIYDSINVVERPPQVAEESSESESQSEPVD